MKPLLRNMIVLVLMFGCDTTKIEPDRMPGSIIISVIRDVTDHHTLVPVADPILSLYRCADNPDAELLFRLKTISDKLYTPVTSCHLPTRVAMEKDNREDDPQFRRKAIRNFYSLVRWSIDTLAAKTDTLSPLDNSDCMRTIFGELQYLAQCKHRQKCLLVFSDVYEKSDLYDVYASGPIEPEAMEAIVAKNHLLPEQLSGITVFFIFLPKDRKQDKTFGQMVAAFKHVIEKRGGLVLVQANNENFSI